MRIARQSWIVNLRAGALALTVGALAVSLAACSSSGGTKKGKYGFPESSQDSSSAITVWVDSTRAAATTAFKKANPNVPIKVVTYDGSANGSNSFKTKMGLYDRSGNGWPDVVFSTQNNDASWASQKTGGKQAFAAVLNQGLVPDDVLSGFAKGALGPCTVDGHVYCLRNDLAQTVLWFNKSLMDQFGYSAPSTWQEYEQLSAKIAQEHPGYITGSAGDTWVPEVFMWASKCQANQVTGARAVKVETTTPECERAAKLIDAGVGDGTLTKLSVFSPDFVKQFSGKVLMMPGPAWFAGAIFNSKTALNVPSGQLGVAAPLSWGDGPAVTGNVGGGTWFVSSHSHNLAAAEKFVQFVTTADDYQVELAPGYPAYASAATKWLAKQADSHYYATSLAPLQAAASQVWSGWGSPEFSQEAIWAKTMAPLVTSGKSVADNLDTWGTAIKNQARVVGYSIS